MEPGLAVPAPGGIPAGMTVTSPEDPEIQAFAVRAFPFKGKTFYGTAAVTLKEPLEYEAYHGNAI